MQIGFAHEFVEALAVSAGVGGDGDRVNGGNFALHTVFDGFAGEEFGFFFFVGIELVDVDVDEFIFGFSGGE